MDMTSTPPPTSPLRRKRTFHDLSDATSSLALQTPNPDAQDQDRDHDPHYGDDYFGSGGVGRNPFALSSSTVTALGGSGEGTGSGRKRDEDQREERSVSPSKRVRVGVLAGRSGMGSSRVGEGRGSPLSAGMVGEGLGIEGGDHVMEDGGALDSAAAVVVERAVMGPEVVPGKIVALEQCGVKFDGLGLLRSLVTEEGARGPTANWGRVGWESTVLVYVCPMWREDFGRGSGGYVSHLDGVGGLGMGFEGLCVAIHNILTQTSPTAQALAISDRLDIPLQTTAPANHVQELTSVLPVRRSPEATAYLQQAATHLLPTADASMLSDGLLVLIDHQSNLRMLLPMSELRKVSVSASTSGSISVARRKAISAALEVVLRDALTYLEEEKAWLKSQR
ncbi:Enhancer of polycomb-like protein 1 [Sphaceloma murrayae]|uniref:Enhancer of polycomb-like protein 1 n=1 Tax=Sphaceloma murrayae TaxID=2082308 RepID=A0A2K1QV71_9PEZI|nr:Enhancer of polycomb-like protein 1 [Sphaceloma murrayae]